jgi:hypothetical protein
MNLEISSRLPSQCAYQDCQSRLCDPNRSQFVRKGVFFRRSDGKWIRRFWCKQCKRSFSTARFSECFRQKKRRLNDAILKLLISGVSQRRIARILNINRKTVVRKFLFLAQQARISQQEFLERYKKQGQKITSAQFDEMESCERSKCLPVSIPLVVESETRKIIGYRVCSMPAKGSLAAISRRKYGYRKDERTQAAQALFSGIKDYLVENPIITSDQKPSYPDWIRAQFPKATHKTHKGRRGCVAGQGELKKIGFDPLFSFNHTAAMLRSNINRLFRRTWCISKLKERLDDHIAIYVQYHNTVLT